MGMVSQNSDLLAKVISKQHTSTTLSVIFIHVFGRLNYAMSILVQWVTSALSWHLNNYLWLMN